MTLQLHHNFKKEVTKINVKTKKADKSIKIQAVVPPRGGHREPWAPNQLMQRLTVSPSINQDTNVKLSKYI